MQTQPLDISARRYGTIRYPHARPTQRPISGALIPTPSNMAAVPAPFFNQYFMYFTYLRYMQTQPIDISARRYGTIRYPHARPTQRPISGALILTPSNMAAVPAPFFNQYFMYFSYLKYMQTQPLDISARRYGTIRYPHARPTQRPISGALIPMPSNMAAVPAPFFNQYFMYFTYLRYMQTQPLDISARRYGTIRYPNARPTQRPISGALIPTPSNMAAIPAPFFNQYFMYFTYLKYMQTQPLDISARRYGTIRYPHARPTQRPISGALIPTPSNMAAVPAPFFNQYFVYFNTYNCICRPSHQTYQRAAMGPFDTHMTGLHSAL